MENTDEQNQVPMYGKASLEGYPGAALLIGSDDTVISSNEKGAPFKSLFENNELPELNKAIETARETHGVVTSSVSLESGQGDIVLEVSIIPFVRWQEADTHMVLIRDLTMERNLRSALVESRQRYKDLVEVNSDFAWEVGTTGIFEFVSPKGALGFKAEDIVGKAAVDLVVGPERYDPVPFCSDVALTNVEIWMVNSKGETACMLTSCVPLLDQHDNWKGTRGICRDVTDERANEAALSHARHREYLLNHIVFAIRDEIDPLNMLSAASTATAEALMSDGARIYRVTEDAYFAVAAEDGDATNIDELEGLFPDMPAKAKSIETEIGDWRVMYTPTLYRQTINGVFAIWRHKDGEPWEDDYRILLCDVANQLGIANEQIANHERILALSRTDSMTGLLNRRAFFEEELPRHIVRLEREENTAALFYVDMDNFKMVNDIHGHQAGDDAILKLREIMLHNSRPGDVIARLGGDEFALWLDNISEDTAYQRALSLVKSSEALKVFSGTPERPLGISVGMAMYDPARKESLETVIGRADQAMYDVKNSGKGGVSVASVEPYDDLSVD